MTTKQGILAQLDAVRERHGSATKELTAALINVAALDDGFATIRTAVEALPDVIDPPTPAEVLLQVEQGFAAPPLPILDRDKLHTMFDIAGKPANEQGFWANHSNSLEVFDDGTFRIWYDKARMGEGGQNTGGSSWCNAALPLTRPTSAARISYKVNFDPVGLGWDYGTSGKMPGLMGWTAGRTPGGGIIGAGQHSTRLAWNDWDRNGTVRIGPYIYGQETRFLPDLIWGPNFPTGTVRWHGPYIPELAEGNIPAGPVLFEEEIIASDLPGMAVVTMAIDGQVRWSNEMKLTDPEFGKVELTHVSFGHMYGGNTPAYGPDQEVTCLEYSDFHVVALAP